MEGDSKMNNLVSVKTEIDDLKSKRDLIKEKVAGLISDTMIRRAKEKQLSSAAYTIDVKNLLDGFSDEEKIDIMITVSYLMLAQVQVGRPTSTDDSARRKRNHNDNYRGGDRRANLFV